MFALRKLPRDLLWLLLVLGTGNGHAFADERAAPDALCSPSASLPAGDSEHSLSVDGTRRTYRLHIPSGHDQSRPAPVVIVLHGGWGTGKVIQWQSRMTRVADKHGFIAVFPDGLHRSWNAGGCCGRAMKRGVDDVGFIAALIDELADSTCVDRRRIYATGFSNGSMLAHRIACELSTRIAAIAAVSGVIMVDSCEPERLVPVIVFHGTEDPRSLWEGGLGDKDPRLGERPSVPSVMDRLRARGACGGKREEFYVRGDARCVSAVACSGDAEMALCRIENHGHQWPGGRAIEKVNGRRVNLGPMSDDISAAEVMWDFFTRHALPAPG